MALETKTSSNPALAVYDQARALVSAAKQGDSSARPKLQKLLDNNPEVWRRAGDLAIHAQFAWIRQAAGDDLLGQESIARQTTRMRDELLGSNATKLERLLVDQVVLAWLALHSLHVASAAPVNEPAKKHEFLDKRLALAQRRYVAAIKGLADVRRLQSLTRTGVKSTVRLHAAPVDQIERTAKAKGPRG